MPCRSPRRGRTRRRPCSRHSLLSARRPATGCGRWTEVMSWAPCAAPSRARGHVRRPCRPLPRRRCAPRSAVWLRVRRIRSTWRPFVVVARRGRCAGSRARAACCPGPLRGAVAMTGQHRLTDGVGRVVGEVVAVLRQLHVRQIGEGVLCTLQEERRLGRASGDRLQAPTGDQHRQMAWLLGSAQRRRHHGSVADEHGMTGLALHMRSGNHCPPTAPWRSGWSG
jgi:hypothetical protein